ncbi:MAG: DUF4150 domain-containing protein [Pseudomonadota bacterium]
MANDVFANSREISCKAADGKSICAFPDVCMTPPENPATPTGVPVPYPNSGMAKDTAKGSKSVKISKKEVMLKNKSYFKKSTGDEAGCATKKGVISSVNRGKVYFNSWAMNVKFEGYNVVRHMDLATHNHGSFPPNTPPWVYIDTMARGGAPAAPGKWDINCLLDILCKEDEADVKKASKLKITAVDPLVFDDPVYKGGKWTTQEFHAGGTQSANEIQMVRDMSCEDAAVTLHHELLHSEQPDTMSWPEKEYDAYKRTEEWSLSRGLPGQHPDFRKVETLPPGFIGPPAIVVDEAAIKDKVDKWYPITAPSKPGGPIPPQVIGRSADGKQVIVEDSAGNQSMRPVKEGDTFPADKPRNPPNDTQIPPKSFACP